MIKNLFWSSDQHRVQAVWRMAFTLVLYGVITAAGTTLLALIMILAGVSGNELTSYVVSKPGWQLALIIMVLVCTLVVSALAARLIDRRRWADLGFHFNRRWWGHFGFGLGLGALLMALIFGVELAAGWITPTVIFVERSAGSFAFDFMLATILFIGVGIYEELLFRGYLIKNLAEGTRAVNPHPRRAVIVAYLLSSAIFGLAHANNPNATWLSTLNIALAGLLLGLPYVLTGELATSMGLHITWNLFQGNVFGFPVSGGIFAPPTLIAIQQGGPELFTGGAFGPEGGLIGVAAMVVGAGLTVLWVRRREGQLVLADTLPTYVARNYKRGEAQ